MRLYATLSSSRTSNRALALSSQLTGVLDHFVGSVSLMVKSKDSSNVPEFFALITFGRSIQVGVSGYPADPQGSLRSGAVLIAESTTQAQPITTSKATNIVARLPDDRTAVFVCLR